MQNIEVLSIQNIFQILAILVLLQGFINFQNVLAADSAIQICNFLQAGNLAMLMLFNRLHKVCRVNKTLMRPGIQPGEALPQQFYIQCPIFQINAIEVGNLQLTAGRRFQILCVLHYAVIIEIQTRYAVIALWLSRLFLNRDYLAILTKHSGSST